ncbi:unnamed protein product [Callosobruchus maculatus]|uniref:Uncharacterized protein n=1 Tax=Callosobruchus maculatus TaxID=64391 RepID=A0A653BWU3_CALMS|nr:unnamed protein product [Callosobruchus maculatus]
MPMSKPLIAASRSSTEWHWPRPWPLSYFNLVLITIPKVIVKVDANVKATHCAFKVKHCVALTSTLASKLILTLFWITVPKVIVKVDANVDVNANVTNCSLKVKH